jgi:hypothetical protein
MTQWSEWTRHNSGEKPAHVPDDAKCIIWATCPLKGAVLLGENKNTPARDWRWSEVLRYRYEIKPKVETVTALACIDFDYRGEWAVYYDDRHRPNVRLTFQTHAGVPQWDTLKAEPLE